MQSRQLLKCVVEVASVLSAVVADAALLPGFVRDCTSICDRLVKQLLSKCRNKFDDLTINSFAANRMIDPRTSSAMHNDVCYASLATPAAAAAPGADKEMRRYYSSDNDLYAAMYERHFSLKKSQLVLEAGSWSELVLMNESFDWLANRIYDLTSRNSKLNSSSSSSRLRRRSSVVAAAAAVNVDSGSSNMLGDVVGARGRNDLLGRWRTRVQVHRLSAPPAAAAAAEQAGAVTAGAAAAAIKAFDLSERCSDFAEQCLLFLRYELHCHYFFFLRDMQVGSYWVAKEPNQPEAFVTELNRDIAMVDEVTCQCLSAEKIRYLWGGSSVLLSSILISSMKLLQDKRVNKKGVAKLRRNFFALQQALANVLSGSGGEAGQLAQFDRARQFVELLLLKVDELDAFQKDNPILFSSEEYNALRNILTDHRKVRTGQKKN
mmetsp:Transcript_7702/g.14623  ORF Transcript_7702/g.14623 Transcript_7702/m.14623 type:complete len:434 (-) Transcript_7702:95-1396(-)